MRRLDDYTNYSIIYSYRSLHLVVRFMFLFMIFISDLIKMNDQIAS